MIATDCDYFMSLSNLIVGLQLRQRISLTIARISFGIFLLFGTISKIAVLSANVAVFLLNGSRAFLFFFIYFPLDSFSVRMFVHCMFWSRVSYFGAMFLVGVVDSFVIYVFLLLFLFLYTHLFCNCWGFDRLVCAVFILLLMFISTSFRGENKTCKIPASSQQLSDAWMCSFYFDDFRQIFMMGQFQFNIKTFPLFVLFIVLTYSMFAI